MPTWLKNILIALAIIIPFTGLIAVGLYAIRYFKNIKFLTPALGDIDFIQAGAVLLTQDPKASFPVDLIVKIQNDNKHKISFSDLSAELSYQGNVVARTSEVQKNYDKVFIAGNSVSSFNYSVDVYPNQILVDAIKAIKLFGGQPLKLDYKIKVNLFGWLPIPYEGTFIYPEPPST